MTAAKRVLSVNVGGIKTVLAGGEQVTTGIWKSPVEGRVALRGVNFVGDDQADRTVHGGPDKAVYAYAREDYDWWTATAGFETPPGLFGENLTTIGISLVNAVVGEQWRVGSALLEVAQPRLPCYKLGIRMGDPRFLRRFMQAGRMGAYFRIVEEGDIGAGDAIDIVSQPAHGITLADMREALDDPELAARLVAVPRLPSFWQRVAGGV